MEGGFGSLPSARSTGGVVDPRGGSGLVHWLFFCFFSLMCSSHFETPPPSELGTPLQARGLAARTSRGVGATPYRSSQYVSSMGPDGTEA